MNELWQSKEDARELAVMFGMNPLQKLKFSGFITAWAGGKLRQQTGPLNFEDEDEDE